MSNPNGFDERALSTIADEAGRALIAAALFDPEAAESLIEKLTPDDFREAAYQGDYMAAVWQAIESLVNQGKRTAPIVVHAEMVRLGIGPRKLDGSPSTTVQDLIGMAGARVAGAPLNEYADKLHGYGVRRRLLMVGSKIKDLAYNEKLDPNEAVTQAEAIVNEVATGDNHQRGLLRVGDLIQRELPILEAMKPLKFTGLRTGIQPLDDLFLGLEPGDLFIIAARPSIGKTALAGAIANNVARAGKGVIFVSAEMNEEQITRRIIAAEGNVNAGMMRSGLIQAPHWESARSRIESSGLLTAPYYIDPYSKSVPEIRRKAIRHMRQHELHLIMVDYLQYLEGHGVYARSGNKVQEVSEISRSLKALAKELGVPIGVLSQLSRSVEQRQNKRPMLSDLRDSGSIEQDADQVALLYRDDYYAEQENRESTEPGIMEAHIAKNRNGGTGTVKLRFIKERMAFEAVK